MRGLVERDAIVMSHNDTQENNILLSLSDNTNLLLIDYEYGYWNPRYYDLGNYANEWTCDNAHPCGTGIAYYMANWPTEPELAALTRSYYLLQKQCEKGADAIDEADWSAEDPACQAAILSVKKAMILNNYYWSVWAIMMLNEDDEVDAAAFNWDFFRGRCTMHRKQVEEFKIGAI